MKRSDIKPSKKRMKRKRLNRVRKTDKRAWEIKADKLWGAYVRERDNHTCQRCGKPGNQPHHIFGRTYKQTRHDPANGICLCFGCHKHMAHGKPEEFRDWIIERIGVTEHTRLKARAYVGGNYDPHMNFISLKALEAE